MNHSIKSLGLPFLVFIFIIFGHVNVTLAQGFVVKDFHSSIMLEKAGYVIVKEEIKVDFREERHGIYRNILFAFSSDGREYKTKISDIDVDGDQFSVSNKNGLTSIKIGDADKTLKGEKTYHLQYKVEGPFILSDEYSEFYWNVTGNDWDNSISHASFEVVLPDSLNVRYNDMRVFTGRSGSNNKDATISQSGNKIYGETTKELAAKEGLTIAIKLPKDYINKSNVLDLQTKQNLKYQKPDVSKFFYLPMLFLTGLLFFWRKLRGPKDDRPVERQYYPPGDLSPAEVGGYYDDTVHDRDVISLLPYWASLGFIRMISTGSGMSFEKLCDIDINRPDYEKRLYDQLFNNRDVFCLSDLKEKFYNENYKVKSAIKMELIRMDLYDWSYSYWFKSWRGILIGVIALLLGVTCMVFGFVVTGGIFLLMGLVTFILCGLHPPASQNGKDIKLHLKGLYQFLKESPSNEISSLLEKDEKYFEKLFPFAVAFGLDKKFILPFKDMGRNAPDYYYGNQSGMYVPVAMSHFSDSFQPKEIASAFSSTPPSSSSSGGFSGGSSGGGFGGGGGGSW